MKRWAEANKRGEKAKFAKALITMPVVDWPLWFWSAEVLNDGKTVRVYFRLGGEKNGPDDLLASAEFPMETHAGLSRLMRPAIGDEAEKTARFRVNGVVWEVGLQGDLRLKDVEIERIPSN